MPVVEFQNCDEAPLVLIVEPWGHRYEVPHLAIAGIRYAPKDGAEDRCHSVVEEGTVEFWCNAASYEYDIVHPSPFARLSWDICVNGGWCGGIVDGNPITVEDLLPRTSEVNARQFAELAMHADGWPEGEALDENHLSWLQSRFVEHMGAESVNAEDLRRNVARPFEDATS
jgi:hypothetical protein